MIGHARVILFLGFLMAPVPAWAAGAGGNGSTVAVKSLILVLIAWGMYKCFSIARRETASTKCLVALGFTLTGYFISNLGVLVRNYTVHSGPVSIVFGILSTIFIIISMVLAIIGLVEYKTEYTQGKRQAIWAIVINSIFLLLITIGVVIGLTARLEREKELFKGETASESVTNTNLNFTIEAPGKPWAKVNAKALNPYASVAFVRSRPQIFYMLIAERGGADLDMSTEGLLEISMGTLKGSSGEFETGESERKMINDMDGLQRITNATVNGKKMSYVHWVSSRNGFFYQQIAFSARRHKDKLIEESGKIFPTFKQMEPDTVCYSIGSDPFGRYESAQFGYAIDLSGTSWTKWSDLHKDIEGADIGGTTNGDMAVFVASVLPLDKADPGHEAIIFAFLHAINIPIDDDKLTLLSKESHDGTTDYLYTYLQVEDGGRWDHKIRISIKPDRAFFLAAWSDKDVAGVGELFNQVNASITMSESTPLPDSSHLDNHGKRVFADVLNRVGLYMDKKDDEENALTYYAAAIANDPADMIYWGNAMRAYNYLKKHREAVEFIETYTGKTTFDNAMVSWHAWHLKQSGNQTQALQTYRQLFSSKHEDEEDFKHYANLLVEMEKLEDIDPAFDSFLKDRENEDLRVFQAEIWHQQGQYEKALAVIEKVEKKSPDTVLDHIFYLRALDRYKEALSLCEQLIAKNEKLGNAWYYKGKSEYDLKWYTKAKRSFEKSREIFPENESIERYLKKLSGILGQGDNSAIKKVIEPVPLPGAISALWNQPVDPAYMQGHGAYYVWNSTGYQWALDGNLKHTLRCKINIVDSAGANDFSTYTIKFNPLYEQLHVNSLVVRDKKGNVIATGDHDNYFIVDLQNSDLNTHDQTLNMPIPQLVPGSTVEIVATKILGNYEHFPFQTKVLTSSYPMVSSSVYVLGDTNKVYIKGVNGVKIESIENGKMAYVQAPMTYRREPGQVNYQLVYPCVFINGVGRDWAGLGEEYLEKIENQLILTDDIRKLARGLVNPDDSRDKKIAKLYRYVQEDYKYMGIEFGSRGEIPNEASKTVENKYGDCKDHAVLFHHLLQSAGIGNHLALVNSRNAIQQDMPSRDQFNHLINYVPGKTGRFWDATNKHSSTSLVTQVNSAGLQALVLEPGNVRFITIPEYDMRDSLIEIDRVFHIDEKVLQVKEKVRVHGYHAAFMRSFLKHKNTDEHQTWGQATIQSYYPSGKLDQMSVENIMENDEPIQLDLVYSIGGKIHATKDGVIINTTGIWEPYYLFSEPVDNRQTGFEIEYPFIFTSAIRIRIPDGFAVEELPENLSYSETDFGDVDMTFSREENAIQYKLNLAAKSGRYPKDRYKAYYQFNQKILQAVSPNITLTRKEMIQN